MTVTNFQKPVGFLLLGLVAGWFAHGGFSKKNGNSAITFNESGSVVEVKGRVYSLSDLPLGMQHKVHTAFLQAQSQMLNVAEDFAARVSMGQGGDSTGFTWEKLLAEKVTEADVEKTYNNTPGFKQLGALSDTRVRGEIKRYLLQRESSQRISEELGKLRKENSFKMIWDLPLAPAIKQDFSMYPVVELGPEGDALPQEMQIMFSYTQPSSEGVFFTLSRLAESLKVRLRLRLLTETNGTAKEAAAIGLIQCLASKPELKRDTWVLQTRLVQDLQRLPDDTKEIPIGKLFPSDPDLVKRLSVCQSNVVDVKPMLANTEAWKPLRIHNLPIVFFSGRRVSEFDPRGFDAVVTTLVSQAQEKKKQ
ncbi:MAG: hypothetical protein RIR26_264 [Pseudomonadota bacterium]|jgi:hypothetical protein